MIIYATIEEAKIAAQVEANRTGWPQRIIAQGSGYDFLSANTPGLGSYINLFIGEPIFREQGVAHAMQKVIKP